MGLRIIYFLLLGSIISFSACNEPDDVLDLNFKLEYNDKPMVMFQEYMYPNGKTFQLQRVSFYLSELNISKDNSTTTVSEVEFIDLTNSHLTEAASSQGYNLKKELDEMNDFDALSFNIGLTPEDNSTVPEDHKSSSPLSFTSEYWRSWNSYVFVKIEGNLDMNEDGEFGAGEGFALHLGSDDAMNSFNFSVDNNEIDITFSVEDIFNYGGELYDLETNRRLHNLTPEVIQSIEFLSKGVKGAVSVN